MFFIQLHMRCIQLGSHIHSKNPAKFLDSLHHETLLYMYYSNKQLKLKNSVYNCKKKHIWNTGIEQINCHFISAMFGFFFFFCNLRAHTAWHQHERVQKTCLQPPQAHMQL